MTLRPGNTPDSDLVALTEEGLAALDDGRLEEAETLSRRALDEAPEAVESLHLAAEVRLEAHPDDREALEEILEAIDRKLREPRRAARSPRRKLRRGIDPEEAGVALQKLGLVRVRLLNHLGMCVEALAQLEALEPGADPLCCLRERAIALYELCRFEEARRAFEALVAAEPAEGWAHHHLGLLAERAGDHDRAVRCFDRARRLEPEAFPEPVRLTEEEFDDAVEEALSLLPTHLRPHMENTVVIVEPLPGWDDLRSSSPPLSPHILGLFRGTPIGERSVTDASGHETVSIVLYQRNLERFARSRHELIEQIGITLMHEIGHLLGLDEDDLSERGLE